MFSLQMHTAYVYLHTDMFKTSLHSGKWDAAARARCGWIKVIKWRRRLDTTIRARWICVLHVPEFEGILISLTFRRVAQFHSHNAPLLIFCSNRHVSNGEWFPGVLEQYGKQQVWKWNCSGNEKKLEKWKSKCFQERNIEPRRNIIKIYY